MRSSEQDLFYSARLGEMGGGGGEVGGGSGMTACYFYHSLFVGDYSNLATQIKSNDLILALVVSSVLLIPPQVG